MKMFRSFLAGACALALLSSVAAEAQSINSSVNDYPGQRPFYSSVTVALTPAASATDFFSISGSASRPIRVLGLRCDGLSTALGNAFVQAVKRSTLDTGGTSTTPAASAYNSTSLATFPASAVVKAYTVNPSALGTTAGVIAEGYVVTGTATAGGTALVFDFSSQNVILNSATEVIALNANAASFPTGASLNCRAQWSES